MDGHEPERLIRSVIAPPLRDKIDSSESAAPGDGARAEPEPVVIELNPSYVEGVAAARERVLDLLGELHATTAGPGPLEARPLSTNSSYLAARMTAEEIRELARRDREAAAGDRTHRAVLRIWPDFPVRPLIDASVATVKADAARLCFGAGGKNVVWAVLDSGIDGGHPHFRAHGNLTPPSPLQHMDFTDGKSPLTDAAGHGTHVAGIIAGELESSAVAPIVGASKECDERGDVSWQTRPLTKVAGMAPQASLLSYKVLDDEGAGNTSTIITALEHIAEVNDHGRNLLIHGVNLSVGYPFDPEWFACGASPLCVVVDRLVRSGVVVVVAAGNTGYGWNQDYFKPEGVAAGLDMTINDPGNARLAVTVGSTHRDMPHRYGVSYFSSKGPTGDGRAKPDLVAPGERILSCAAGRTAADAQAKCGPIHYVEDSGTSMAAPHVSGCIASLLSIRREYLGRPEDVKEVFLRSATDLGRVPAFQGSGLVDLMRAIQSV
ncbi:MAG: S8 family peptidase [Pseudonocardiaceae bacterium]